MPKNIVTAFYDELTVPLKFIVLLCFECTCGSCTYYARKFSQTLPNMKEKIEKLPKIRWKVVKIFQLSQHILMQA